MSRKTEKPQSMLHRFRENQALELGVQRTGDGRRPRMTSNVSSIRECEKWRGDILKEISRKISKIQDAGMGDYEVRDLNDEINNLMREKSHWERQIISLGGANYRRGMTAMLDDDGREVPGTRGYKYFGRAKDLPGVKELFTRGAVEETEESARTTSFKKFQKQGPAYFGDVDEQDTSLIDAENEEEEADWLAATQAAADVLNCELSELPSQPKPSSSKTPLAAPTTATSSTSAAKRKATDQDGDVEMGDESSKKSKGEDEGTAPATEAISAEVQAAAASFMSIFDPASLVTPQLPTREEMASALLDVRKKALMAEYGVEE